MKHIINVVILIAVVAVVVGLGLNNLDLLPPLASAEGLLVDRLFSLHLQVIAFLFALIMVFMLYSVVVFRRKPGDEEDGPHVHGNTTLEIVWTIAPLIVVVYFSALGANYYWDITAENPDELVVEVIGSQFSWRFDYPESGISSAELNLPNDRPVLFEITSIDVIHSFWVPEFRIKQDAVPGMVQPLRVTPTQVGQYRLRCAELCGLQHSTMYAEVNVMEPGDFENWLAGQSAPSDDPVERGAKLSEVQGCIACHSLDGSVGVGPSWAGVFGSEESLDDGTTVTVDEEYLRQSILDPNSQIVSGFNPNLMPPSYGDILTPEDIDDLIAFIKSLGN